MSDKGTVEASGRGFRFLPLARPFSAGVVALPGFEVRREVFDPPLPLERLPDLPLCAVELRSPAPMDADAFRKLNRRYEAVLEKRGLLIDGRSPLARTNVCPVDDPPGDVVVHAVAWAVAGTRGGFVVSGIAEVPDAPGSYPERILRRGDVTPEGLREKLRWVQAALEGRRAALGVAGGTTTLYSAHALPGAVRARPPLAELEVEVDAREVS